MLLVLIIYLLSIFYLSCPMFFMNIHITWNVWGGYNSERVMLPYLSLQSYNYLYKWTYVQVLIEATVKLN